ncbi:MAG: Nif3-like dinuclear metal center hexameric protein [Oscillospiraceae bacterium]
MKIGELLKYLDEKAPLSSAASFDNVGLLVGDENAEITGVCCCLDITHDIIKEAEEKSANLIVSHHPVIFDGLKIIPEWNPVSGLLRKHIAAIAMHTNFDIADGGVNDTLVELLDFSSEGVTKYEKFHDGYGVIVDLPFAYSTEGLAEYCGDRLSASGTRCSRKNRTIRRVAVCCGAGIDRDVMEFARKNRIDAIISGDIKHNFWIEAENCGISLIDAGHYGTEKAAAHRLAKVITEAVPSVPVFSADCEKDPCKYSWEMNLK